MESTIENILRSKNLSLTESRKKILHYFLMSSGAISHTDIEKRSGEKFDRVTVYRTLQKFLEKGIIHNIPTSDDQILYALCKDSCEEGHHHDNHVHFICEQCGKTVCLNHVLVPYVKVPKGYKTTDIQMTVKGVCDECAG